MKFSDDTSDKKELTDVANEQLNNRRSERRAWVWIMLMVNIVFILLLMTLGIVALRVGNYLPDNTDLLFIVGRNPSVEFGEGDGKKWEAGKEVDIFKAEYVNGEGQTTVVSQDGTSVIAPGTETKYQFTMYNNGNVAVVYETDIDFFLKIGDVDQEQYAFPLEIRIKSESLGYLIGSEKQWVNVNDAKLVKKVSVLGASSFDLFTVELRWLFDGGNDELDTMYGNLALEQGVNLTLKINTYAESHVDPTAQGGVKIDDPDGNQEYGGTIRMLWFILLLINIAILIFYISWLLNKRLRKW